MVALKFRACLRPLLLAMLMFCPAAGFCVDRAAQELQLEALKAQISKLEKKLRQQTGERSQSYQDLRSAEINIGKFSRRIITTRKDIAQQDKALNKLSGKIAKLEQRLSLHRKSIRQQIRIAYQLGNRATLQLMLNQEDPAQLGRALSYANYLNQARLDAMAESKLLAQELNQLRQRHQLNRNQLAATNYQLLNDRKQLVKQNTQRQTAIKQLDAELNVGGKQLHGMQQDRQRLEALLRSLGELLADIPPPPLEQRPFKSMRGKLQWPLPGKILENFNQPRGAGDLRWRGLLIGAPQGDKVRSVYYGQVVFADWLSGFGLISIVDHGEGFMSLYAHNESLLKETGDWVSPGEILATAGSSGGQGGTGLYFEIRVQGRTVNPQNWLDAKQRLSQNYR